MTDETEPLPPASRDDLVATFRVAMQLDEIVLRRRRHDVGFARRGVAALFTGTAGTGKTLAARVLAGTLQCELRRIAVTAAPATLERAFTRAANDEVILLIEARAALRGGGDTAPLDWLMQRIESHPGLTIVESDVAAHIDTAFLRRFDVLIEFNLPDARTREAIRARGFTPP